MGHREWTLVGLWIAVMVAMCLAGCAGWDCQHVCDGMDLNTYECQDAIRSCHEMEQKSDSQRMDRLVAPAAVKEPV